MPVIVPRFPYRDHAPMGHFTDSTPFEPTAASFHVECIVLDKYKYADTEVALRY